MSAPTLICLPPAGAGPSLFRGWHAADRHILAPSLPGREGRFGETPPATLEALADNLAREIAPSLPLRYGMFGYSMGGAVSWLLAQRLVAAGHPPPEAMFVLGALAPDDLAASTGRITAMNSADFWAEIARIGGTPSEIISDPELRALFEPVLRRDFAACSLLSTDADPYRLPCPVDVFVAAEDHLVSPEGARAGWARFTDRATKLHSLPGEHMLSPTAFNALRSQIRALWPAHAAA